jgi:putative hydrolases of HD superfamily
MIYSKDLIEKIAFISEIEKLKIIYRQNGVIDKSRAENSAEHSWHIALMALLLQEHTIFKDLDILKVLKMLLIHDIVEIDAGDTFLYDDKGKDIAIDTEKNAALRIFGLLPTPHKEDFISIWLEFEEKMTPEAQYAASIDALQPLLNHLITAKENENPNKISKSKVLNKKAFIGKISEDLWIVAQDIIEKSVIKGLYENPEEDN